MSQRKLEVTCISYLDTYDESSLNAIIETPMESHAKYCGDERTGPFKLSTVMPAGAVCPYSFGSLPSTQGDDSDPMDIHQIAGKKFKPLGRFGPARATALGRRAMSCFQQEQAA